MKNKHGHTVPLKQRAQTIADYLQDDHWTNNMDNIPPPDNDNILPNLQIDESILKIEELNNAFKSLKINKQPGTDRLITELMKWLNPINRTRLLDCLNDWYINENLPENIALARVVPIFKKGDTDNAANYRPISLLKSIYKIYTIIIRQRLQEKLEAHINQTQHGSRPAHSTAHALFAIRRIQDYAEQKGTALNLVLLDWEKAF